MDIGSNPHIYAHRLGGGRSAAGAVRHRNSGCACAGASSHRDAAAALGLRAEAYQSRRLRDSPASNRVAAVCGIAAHIYRAGAAGGYCGIRRRSREDDRRGSPDGYLDRSADGMAAGGGVGHGEASGALGAVQHYRVAARVRDAGHAGYLSSIHTRSSTARDGVAASADFRHIIRSVNSESPQIAAAFQSRSGIGDSAVGADVYGEGALYCASACGERGFERSVPLVGWSEIVYGVHGVVAAVAGNGDLGCVYLCGIAAFYDYKMPVGFCGVLESIDHKGAVATEGECCWGGEAYPARRACADLYSGIQGRAAGGDIRNSELVAALDPAELYLKHAVSSAYHGLEARGHIPGVVAAYGVVAVAGVIGCVYDDLFQYSPGEVRGGGVCDVGSRPYGHGDGACAGVAA